MTHVANFSTKDERKNASIKETMPALGIPYSSLSIGVPKETYPLEKRVSQTPESVGKLVAAGFKVKVEKGAGGASNFSDEMYAKAGADLVDSHSAWAADIVTHIRPPTSAEAALVGNRTICSMLWPAQNKDLVNQLSKQGATSLSMDCIPRTLSRGQVAAFIASFQANF